MTLTSIRDAICLAPKLKISASVGLHSYHRLQQDTAVVEKTSRIRVYIKDTNENRGEGVYERLKYLKRAIPDVQIKGLPRVDRGVIAKDEKDSSVNRLLVTGYGLAEVMGTDGMSDL